MTKEKLRKILKENEALDIDSIPVEEKKSIHLFYGVWLYHVHFLSVFFQKGFSEWEILGVGNCKEQFSVLPDVAKCLLDYVETDVLGATLDDKAICIRWQRAISPMCFILV